MNHPLNRRAFLECAGKVAVVTGGASFLHKLQRLNEAALDGIAGRPGAPAATYKALVCVYLAGGHDSYNMLVPRSGADYTTYLTSRDLLAVDTSVSLPLTPLTNTGRDFGLHPAATDLQTLFAAGKLAFVANVGPLAVPITRAQYRAGGTSKPKNLFSHSDQTSLWQAQSALPDTTYGWGGRMADFIVGLNNGSGLSPALSIAGSSRLLRGQTVAPYAMTTNGSVALSGTSTTSGTDGARRLASYQRVLGQMHGHAMERAFADMRVDAIALDGQIRAALTAAAPLATVFPTTSIGRQLQMAARMIGIRNSLAVQRQVFFTNMGGYDTHDNQLTDHPLLLTALGQALAAFQSAMAELGVEADVTLFTLSEFGRTLSTNGRGTDHGWGGVQLVLGGGVHGQDIYGTMPNYTLEGPDDSGSGRIIPTTSVDQFAATLASWFGVQSADLPTVFPRLSNFASSNLGFV
jgi:uncharacterized protein (DUF1501 family)